MKMIPLTQGKFAIIDDVDFESVSRFKWHVTSRVTSRGYASVTVYLGMIGGKGKWGHLSLHQLIMRPPYPLEVDHKNHDTLDCRRVNMRVCTGSENQHNQVKRKGTSKYKGVYWNKARTKWQAQIRLNGKRIYLGRFDNEAEAAFTYDAKAIELFGEFAYLNYPLEYPRRVN